MRLNAEMAFTGSKSHWLTMNVSGSTIAQLAQTVSQAVGWQANINLEQGLALTYQDFMRQNSI